MPQSPDIARHKRTLEALYFHAGLGKERGIFVKQLDRLLHRCADPLMTLTHLVRFVEASFNQTTLLDDFAAYPVLLETAVTLFDTSRFFSEILIRDPELFRWLTATDIISRSRTQGQMQQLAADGIAIFRTPEKKINALKRFQRRELLRIGARDLLSHAEFTGTIAELSALADALIVSACAIAMQETTEHFGGKPDSEWSIIALGKLGGNELNYSSDIDLVAVYENDGVLPESNRTHDEFFTRFYEAVIRILSATTEEGYLYRVDTRLRPDGNSGPLIRSFGATMSYYESRGELWERQMLIKVRCAAGSKALGTRLLDRLRPFVYPRSLFANPLTEIARIKSRIEAQSGDEFNIKLCPGGIRDIEFVVQALQLMNGGRSPELQIGTTLDAIDRLARKGMLSSPEAATLRDAYRFYRQVEHRLQMLDYAQTHSLPIAPSERTKLALRMEMRLSSFDRALKVSMASVRQIFDAVFAVDIAAVPSDVERLLLENIDSVFVQQFCSLYRLRDRVAAVKRLRRMLHGSGLPGMKEFTEQTRSAFRTIAPQLLAHIGSTDDPDETLARCEQVFSSFPAVDSLYRALANPSLSSAVTVLCGKSRWITRRLANNRALVDYLITRLPDIAAGADNPFPDTVDACSLAEWKLQTESTAGMRYLLGITDERQFFASVSRTAERIVEAIFQSESRRLKLPASTSFCILALGKLGGNELLPGSDLDLIFIFHATKKTDAGRCEKLAASIIERASAITPEGSLYDVDARLRPEGRNAPLAVSLQSYEEYLKKRASLWERQSLTRARVVAGNTSLADDLQSLIHGAVFGTPLPADWRAQILSMRKKTEARSHTRTSYFFDAKLSAGGLMDIEFSVQALQLAAGPSAPDSANTYELLDFHAAQTGILQPMIRNYAVLRRLETALRLALDISSSVVPTDRGAQNTIARWLGCSGLEELGQQVKTIAKQNRAILESILTTHT